MTQDYALYNRKAASYLRAHRKVAEQAAKAANQNLEGAMHVRDPLDFWIKQVKLLFCIKLQCI